MAIKIVDINVTTKYSWQDINDYKDWNTVKNTCISWQSILQTSEVNQDIKIEVEVTEGTWSSLRDLYSKWDNVKSKFTNWLSLKNW